MANRHNNVHTLVSEWLDTKLVYGWMTQTSMRRACTELIIEMCNRNWEEDGDIVLTELKDPRSKSRHAFLEKLHDALENSSLAKRPSRATQNNYIRNAFNYCLFNELPCSSAQVTGLTDYKSWLEKQEQEEQEEVEEEEQQAQEQQSQPVHTLGQELLRLAELRKEGHISHAQFENGKLIAFANAKAAAIANLTNS